MEFSRAPWKKTGGLLISLWTRGARLIYDKMLAWLLGTKELWEWCSDGDLDKVRAALGRGEDVNGKSPDGGTGLIVAVAKHHNAVVDLLLQQPTIDVNYNGNGGYSALDQACLVNNAEAVLMLACNATLTSLNLWTLAGNFPLMIAVKRGYVECARVLVALPGQNMQKREQWDSQRSVLEVAREIGNLEMVAILERAMVREARAGNPLWKLCMQGDLGGVREALRRGGANVNEIGPDGKTGLILAVCERQFHMLQFLLQQPGIDISCRDNHGFTALHRALLVRDDIQLSSMALLSNTSTLNTKDAGGRTPLMLALHMGLAECVEVLVAVPGVDLDMRDTGGRNCWLLARDIGGGKISNLLNMRMRTPEERPLVEMCEEGDLVGVRRVLTKMRSDEMGHSMFHITLMFAVQNQLASVVEFLLREPDFCFENEKNFLTLDTALHCACQEDNIAALSLLARHPSKPDLNTENSRGETPLMVAVKCGSIYSVRFLVSLPGVNMETKDKEGRSLMEIARLDGDDSEIMRLVDGNERPNLGKKKKNTKKGKGKGNGDKGSKDKKMLSNTELAKENERMLCNEASGSQDVQDCKERHLKELEELLRRHEERQNEVIRENKERLQKQQKQNEERLEQMIKENEKEVTTMMKEHLKEKKKATHTAVLRSPPAQPTAPECPVCFEEMPPPSRIFQCKDGHLICEPCRKDLAPTLCPTCRGELTGRATAMEQYIRSIFENSTSGTL